MKSKKYSDREVLLLNEAKHLIETQGVMSFRFSELASVVKCSVGTLYSHFTNKEDLFLAIQTQNLERHLLHFPSLFNCELTPAEIWLAITLLPFWHAKQTGLGTGVHVMAELPSLLHRASSGRRQAFLNKLNSCCLGIDALLKRAKAAGELYSCSDEIALVRTSVVCIQRGAMALSDVEICGNSPRLLDEHNFSRCLFGCINQLEWKRPLNSDSYAKVIKQINRIVMIYDE